MERLLHLLSRMVNTNLLTLWCVLIWCWKLFTLVEGVNQVLISKHVYFLFFSFLFFSGLKNTFNFVFDWFWVLQNFFFLRWCESYYYNSRPVGQVTQTSWSVHMCQAACSSHMNTQHAPTHTYTARTHKHTDTHAHTSTNIHGCANTPHIPHTHTHKHTRTRTRTPHTHTHVFKHIVVINVINV